MTMMIIPTRKKSTTLLQHHPNNQSMMEINGIGNLPRDLIIEILSRLPVKPLCKFRCVSKQWLNLLTYDDHFISQQFQQSKKNPIFLFRKYASNQTKVELNDKVLVELTGTNIPGRVITKINTPVDGPINSFTSSGPLVLLSCPFQIYVCNPGAEELVRLPGSSTMSRYCTVGFGRCKLENEYKIVHLFPSDPISGHDEGMKCEVFSLNHGRDVDLGVWRKAQDCPFKVQTHGLSVSVGGFLYWMVSDESNKSILSFDLDTEEFELISYPKSCSSGSSIFLTGYKNCLCLSDISSNTSSAVMDIWLIKDKRSKIWAKEGSFNLSRLGGSNTTRIKGVVPCNDNDAGIVFDTEEHGLIEYNVDTNGFRKIKTESEERHKLPCIYYDSFFSL